MTVAKVAYDEMSEEERKAVHEILKHHPHYTTYLTKNKPDGPLEEWVFLRAATWPDSVRRPKDWKPDLTGKADPVVRFHRPGDHFTNFPAFAKDATPAFVAKVREKAVPHDIVCALKQRAAELGLKTAAAEDRAVALCWILHLVGDVHQPLHCATLYKESPDPATDFHTGDVGGNAIALRVGEKKVKVRLHAYWDELLGVTSDPAAETRDTAGSAEEAYKVATLAAARVKKAHPRLALGELKTGKEFKDWANESFELAQKVAYWDGKIAELAVRAAPYSADLPEVVNEEPAGYSAKASQVADRLGATAGYRIADTLQLVLK